MAWVRADTPACVDKAGRPFFPLRRLRIHGRTFLRNSGTAPPPHAGGEIGSGHGVVPSWRVYREARLECQEPFVWVTGAWVTGAASELVGAEGSAACGLFIADVGCSVTARTARAASSIFARTLRARRIRFTSGRSTVTPVVRMRASAVGPSTSSNANQLTPRPPKIAPGVRFTHCHKPIPSTTSSTGITNRNAHRRLGQITIDSRSRK